MTDALVVPVGAASGRGRAGAGRIAALNKEWHGRALLILGAVVVAHWAEHIVQAIQIWGLGYRPSAAHGMIGAEWPWLVTSEWLHYLFALLMLVGIAVLRPAFSGRARTFWTIALVIQIWHFFEHQILFVQAQTHHYWFGGKVPTSVLQHFWPMDRVQIHLVYNTLVTIPMVVAMYFHRWPPEHERGIVRHCACHHPTPELRLAA